MWVSAQQYQSTLACFCAHARARYKKLDERSHSCSRRDALDGPPAAAG